MNRRAFTLLELTLSTVVLTILVGSTLSCLMIVSRAVDDGDSLSRRTTHTGEALGQLDRDVQLSTSVSTIEPHLLAVTVPDRDNPADGEDDTITYAWNGTAGDPLLRSVNDQEPVAVLDDVHAFTVGALEQTAVAEAFEPLEPVPNRWGYFRSTADVPPPSVLMVIEHHNPSSDEQNRLSQLSAWGMAVTLIDEDASSGSFDDALEDADVVYVSDDVNPNDVYWDLRDAAVGIVTEAGGLSIGLRMETSCADYRGTSVDLIDVDHNITSGFALGPLAVLDELDDLGIVYAGLAPGAIVLANRAATTSPVMTVIDTNGERTDGSPSPARRVRMPWAFGGFRFSRLNYEGRELLRRSLYWASGVELPPFEPGVTTVHTVAVNADDAIEQSSGSIVSGDYTLGVGLPGQYTALRFQGIGVPAGATIQAAHLSLRARQNHTGESLFTIVGEQSSDAPAILNDPNNISNRVTTGASAAWFASDWEQSEWYDSPDLQQIIQEIIEIENWSAGYAIVLIIKDGTGAGRTAWPVEWGTGVAPRLTIRYAEAGE